MARCPRGMSSECIAKIGKIVSESKVIKFLTTMFSQIQSAKYVSEAIIIAVIAKGFNDGDRISQPLALMLLCAFSKNYCCKFLSSGLF